MVNQRLAIDILDDGRVAAGIFDGEVNGGFSASGFSHDNLNILQQSQCLGDSGRFVQ